MMKRLSDRFLNNLNFASLLGVCGFTFPFGYFGQWAIVLSWVICFYLWVESDFEQGRRGLHPNGNV